MIELLIQYIRDKGYIVDVRPSTLLIRKYAKDQLFSIAWMIFKDDLRPDAEELLYYQATRKCDEIEQAISEYTIGQPDN